MADQGAGAAAGAGKLRGINGFHEVIIRFLGNGVAFIAQYGYHNLNGGIHPSGCPRCFWKAGANFGR